MADSLTLLAEALASTSTKFVQVSPDGFRIGNAAHVELRATIASWTLVRKLFRDRRPVCRSNDGETSTDGKFCLDCQDRSLCTPRVRLCLTRVTGIPPGADPRLAFAAHLGDVVLELAPASGRNFLAHAWQIAHGHAEIGDVPVRLTIVHHDSWREVCFTSHPDPVPEMP